MKDCSDLDVLDVLTAGQLFIGMDLCPNGENGVCGDGLTPSPYMPFFKFGALRMPRQGKCKRPGCSCFA